MMQSALVKSDFESIEIIGHKMRGTSAGYGVEELAKLATKLKLQQKPKNGPVLNTLLDLFRTYLENLEIVYKK